MENACKFCLLDEVIRFKLLYHIIYLLPNKYKTSRPQCYIKIKMILGKSNFSKISLTRPTKKEYKLIYD